MRLRYKKHEKPYYVKAGLCLGDIWHLCECMQIPMNCNNIQSCYEKLNYNNEEKALFLIGLDYLYDHSVALFIKDGNLYYFDCWGTELFNEIKDFSEEHKLNFLYKRDKQIQGIFSSDCVWFSLYFLKEMNGGKSYDEVLSVFSDGDFEKNEQFIKNYFETHLSN